MKKIIFLVLLLLASFWFFPRAGEFLVDRDSFEHAETALVLSGDPVKRTLAAKDLYVAGKADQILIIPEPRDETSEQELIKLGLLDPTEKRLSMSEKILLKAGVPQTQITFLPESVDGTIVEAKKVDQFLEGHYPKSMVVITSKFASRRACYLFDQVLKNKISEIYCYPTPYDPFDPKTWWKRPRNALYVLMEYQKFVVNFIDLLIKSDEDRPKEKQ